MVRACSKATWTPWTLCLLPVSWVVMPVYARKWWSSGPVKSPLPILCVYLPSSFSWKEIYFLDKLKCWISDFYLKHKISVSFFLNQYSNSLDFFLGLALPPSIQVNCTYLHCGCKWPETGTRACSSEFWYWSLPNESPQQCCSSEDQVPLGWVRAGTSPKDKQELQPPVNPQPPGEASSDGTSCAGSVLWTHQLEASPETTEQLPQDPGVWASSTGCCHHCPEEALVARVARWRAALSHPARVHAALHAWLVTWLVAALLPSPFQARKLRKVLTP